MVDTDLFLECFLLLLLLQHHEFKHHKGYTPIHMWIYDHTQVCLHCFQWHYST